MLQVIVNQARSMLCFIANICIEVFFHTLLVVLDIIGAQCFLCFNFVYEKMYLYTEISFYIDFSQVNDHLQDCM